MSGSERGYFIVLEGLDGSGKSALSLRLTQTLSARLGGDRVLHTFEPKDSAVAGEYIRAILGKRIVTTARTLALAFALNRADHNERVMAPFVADHPHGVILCDRYLMSSLVYQTGGDVMTEEVLLLNRTARTPDLTVFLDASPETCYARIGARGGERELYEVRLAETRAKYLEVITFLRGRGETILIVDANSDIETVAAALIAAIDAHSPPWMQG